MCTPKSSAMLPIITGKMAPPRIIITRSDEPLLVCFPNPEMARVNIFDHIIELNKPIPITDHMAICPLFNKAMNKEIIFTKANR